MMKGDNRSAFAVRRSAFSDGSFLYDLCALSEKSTSGPPQLPARYNATMIRRFVTVLLACSLLVIVGITIFGQFWVFHRRVANGTIYVGQSGVTLGLVSMASTFGRSPTA